MAASSSISFGRTDNEAPRSVVSRAVGAAIQVSSSASRSHLTLSHEFSKLQVFIDERRQTSTPCGDLEAQEYTNLFQRCVEDTVRSIQSKQIEHEMQAKALLATAVAQVEEPKVASDVLEQVSNLSASFETAARDAADQIRQLEKIAVAAAGKQGNESSPSTSLESILQKEVKKIVWSSAFLVVISDVYETIRSAKGQEAPQKWAAPATFQRKTTKYWYAH